MQPDNRPMNKDGTPVVPACLECRWCIDEGKLHPVCVSPNNKTFDPVYGYTTIPVRCRTLRESNNSCGVPGNWFEWKPEPEKPGIWKRIKNRFKLWGNSKAI